jgi:hypothetical protein
MLKVKCEECDKYKKDVYWSPEAHMNVCVPCAKRIGVRIDNLEERGMQDNDAVNYEEAEDQLNRMGRLLDE